MTVDEELDQQEADAAELEQLLSQLQAEIAVLDKIEQDTNAFAETLRNGT